MTMRVTNPFSNHQTLLDLQRSKARMASLQEQITTGNRIVDIADDPTGTSLVMNFQTSIDRNTQYLKQVNDAQGFLQDTETVVTSLNDQVTQLLSLAQQGLGNSTGATGRAALAPEVDNIRTSLISMANTQEDGKYLFAGTKTLTQPFSDPSVATTTYSGDSNSIPLDVSVGASVVTNVPGSTLFMPGGQGSSTDIFQTVSDLSTALKNNDVAGIQTASNNLKGILTNVNTVLTDIGGRQSMLSSIKDSLGSFNDSLQSVQKSYQGVDYPTAITQFYSESTAQQAVYSTMSKMNKTSLLDYLS